MPQLVRFYILHCVIGFGIAAVFVAGLVAFDVAHLRHLVIHTEAGPFALLILWVLNGIVFAGVQFGIAVMRLSTQDDDRSGPDDGGEMIPIRVAARAPKRATRKL